MTQTKTRPFDIFRKQLRGQDPTSSFERWAEYDNGTGRQALYHHWHRAKGKMFLFLVFEETGEFSTFELIGDKKVSSFFGLSSNTEVHVTAESERFEEARMDNI